MWPDCRQIKLLGRGQRLHAFLKLRTGLGSGCYFTSLPFFLSDAQVWELVIDLKGCGKYCDVIQRSPQRPGIVVYFVSKCQIMLVELTAPYRPRIEGQHMHKVATYEGLDTDLRVDGCILRFCAVDMGARVLVSMSTYADTMYSTNWN